MHLMFFGKQIGKFAAHQGYFIIKDENMLMFYNILKN